MKQAPEKTKVTDWFMKKILLRDLLSYCWAEQALGYVIKENKLKNETITKFR